ncbi:MAG: CRP-like cAMP-binding protein [Ulvibacter sp.]|jgi:CRP-like cAMP-binding protein|tara:strand:+ start:1739 stop:2332 length:594 start_codon:yes stop_codon:yes gene_type:complete
MEFSNSEIQDLLKKFYPNLEEKEIDSILSISKYHFAQSKKIILNSGRTHKNLILILNGVARAYSINENGEELNDFIRAEGKVIGDSRVFGDDIQILNIEAIGEIHYLQFNVDKLEALGFDNPEVMRFYLNMLKEIILTFTYRLNTFITMTPKERYIDLLRWNPILIESSYDKHLASFLGIKPLTIHRIKKDISRPIK